MTDKPSVLFVCVHHAGRSQTAAGFFTLLGRLIRGVRLEVASAWNRMELFRIRPSVP
jgi:protein-tyrosine-phosphatase